MGWEPWTGCYKTSDGCTYCFYYGLHSKRYGQNEVVRTDEFYKPIETVYMPRKKITKFKMAGGKTVDTCFTTDFFIPEADEWRMEVWNIIKQRPDLHFFIITKRIDRFNVSLPTDWGDGYDNVTIGCTVENQEMVDYRLPLFLSYPIKHRIIVCAPLLEEVNLKPYLNGIQHVSTSGETGKDARECDYSWILNIREHCKEASVPFSFRSTGSRMRKDGTLHTINPKMQHRIARDTSIDISGEDDYTVS